VGRALILNPRILLLDEPLEGLAPILVEELLVALRNIIRGEGVSAILVEQNARKVLSVTDRVAILERGSVIYEDSSESLIANPRILEAHLGVTEGRSRRMTRPSQH
jgi:branched-chain amino acid transport system ATP-binding protein